MTYTINLTHGKQAIVDASDYFRLSRYKWRVYKAKTGTLYAVTSRYNNGRFTSMHAAIVSPKAGFQIDHVDGDGLNNRRDNLRYATHQQQQFNRKRPNKRNSSGHKGVTWNDKRQRWMAQIGYSGINIYLGLFSNKTQAAAAYDSAAHRLHGEFYAGSKPRGSNDT